jgi:hypothetical protein
MPFVQAAVKRGCLEGAKYVKGAVIALCMLGERMRARRHDL